MASIRIPACHEANKFSMIYVVTGCQTKNSFDLGKRAYRYFYYFALIVLMNKRLM